MSKIKVELKDRSYNIVVGFNILKGIDKYLKDIQTSNFKLQNKSQRSKSKVQKKIAIITNPVVDALYGNIVRRGLKGYKIFTFRVPDGEKYKTLATASALYDQLIANNFHRDDLIIALGGGVIGDLAGFVAGTYMRGIDIIQAPTTLLAQVDASIGGKTAVDHKAGKNMIGVFHQPRLVLADAETLKTLTARELKTGLAEVVKYGMIADAGIFRLLESNPKSNLEFWEEIITLSAQIKAQVVSEDERETKGRREILNFGHTIGHALESASNYAEFTHGEAVALGMIAASFMAVKLDLFKRTEYERVKELIAKLKLPVKAKFDEQKVLELLKHDKKVKAGKIRFVLPVKIGKVVVREDIPLSLVSKAIQQIL